MTEWEGKLSKKRDKDWHSVKLYAFQLEGVDRWFSTGKVEIIEEVDHLIAFEERNGKVDPASVVEISKQSDVVQQPTVQSVSVSEPAPTGTPAAYSDVVGQRIQWQNARADACRVVVAALEQDALPWNKNLAKGKRLDHLLGYINELTKQFIQEEPA
jgi:hypothetical protein